jgi:TIR domain
MTGAAGGAGPDAGSAWRWDVALSFAGAQRNYVEQVADALTARGVRCFYDADEQIELWGKYLAEELPAIYGEQAAAVVVFVSAEYAARDWIRLERRAALNRAVRERQEYVLPARFDDTPLPGLLSDMVAIDLRTRMPQQFATMIADKLARLAITASAPSANAGNPAQDVESAPPAGAVRVGDVDPRRLGVHAAISVPGVPDDVLPEYVLRDVDTAGSGVRAKVAAAAERGGFVLLVGGSSVGKTRCAAEAVRAVLPDWWLVHPAGSAQVAALAQVPSPRTVVWLNELQDYLDGEHGLAGAAVRALLNHPAVIIGTLWPDRYDTYTTVPRPGGADPNKRERQVLDLADVVRIAPSFSEAEQGRAHAVAARDPRLRVALEAAGYGLTQTLAAAPQLVARWQDAQTASPYAWAVLTAALDVARLGARAPLSRDLLRAAAPGYCTSQQQAEAPDDWFEQALAYATGKLHGAAAAFSPAGAGMGQMVGYTAADYLIQHASRERRSARVPASTWDAIVSYLRDPGDAARLADSARSRLLYRYAISLYRHAADVGDGYAARWLADLLAHRGDVDGLRARADAGDGVAARRLAMRLAGHGDIDGAAQILRGRADVGDGYSAQWLADLLAKRGDTDGLCALADVGGRAAARWLADLLADRGDVDGLRARADAGDEFAASRLADLLAHRGDVDGLRARADAGDGDAARRLAGLFAGHGDIDGPHRYCVPGPTQTGTPLRSWPICWPGAATWTGPHRYCAPGPTPATGTPHRGWLGCWPSAVTSTGCAPGPTPATGLLPGGLPICWPSGGTWTGPSRSCGPGPTPGTGLPPGHWPGCWPSAATWTGCAPRSMPGTGTPPGSWPIC